MFRSMPMFLSVCVCWLWTEINLVAQVSLDASLQYARDRRSRRYYVWHSPGTALSARVHAQADLLRSTGDAVVDFSVARRIRADAVRAEMNNSVERVKAYWERKRINEEERARRYVDPETRRRRINSKTWQKLQLHPNVNAQQIASGRALNFLMYRLSATALTWDPSNPPEEFDSRTLKYFALTPEVLHCLQLQQTTGQSRLVFRADEGVPLKMDWWPYLLRRDEFESLRNELIVKRQAVIDDATYDGEITVKTLEDLELASVNLSTEFRKRYSRRRRLQGGTSSFREARDVDLFLHSMDLEIARLQRTGDATTFNESLRFDPEPSERHLPSLLSYMSRNGLKFAPPQPGDEAAYFATFQLLRDFYLAYDDDDEGLKDRKKKRSVS